GQARDGPHAVFATRKRLVVYVDVAVHRDRGGLVGAWVPHLIEWNDSAEQLAPPRHRAAVRDGDLGVRDALRHGCRLALPYLIERNDSEGRVARRGVAPQRIGHRLDVATGITLTR